MRRVREGARVVLRDARGRVLLLHFRYRSGALAGTDYWGLPGGGVESGETPAQAAVRELREETGVGIGDAGPLRFESSYDFRLSSGEEVAQRDCYFLVDAEDGVRLSRDGVTPEEAETLVESRWWRPEELRSTRERIVPANMADILERVCGGEIRR